MFVNHVLITRTLSFFVFTGVQRECAQIIFQRHTNVSSMLWNVILQIHRQVLLEKCPLDLLLIQTKSMHKHRHISPHCVATFLSLGGVSVDAIIWQTDLHIDEIVAYHYLSSQFDSRPWQGVLDIMLCHEVYQGLALGQLFSLGTPVSYANKVQIGLKLKFFLMIPVHTTYIN